MMTTSERIRFAVKAIFILLFGGNLAICLAVAAKNILADACGFGFGDIVGTVASCAIIAFASYRYASWFLDYPERLQLKKLTKSNRGN